jgi:hypothetical protein
MASYAARAAAALPSATLPLNRSQIAASTASIVTTPDKAAKPPSSAALGTGLPTCCWASSVAATVCTASGRSVLVNSSIPRSATGRAELISSSSTFVPAASNTFT